MLDEILEYQQYSFDLKNHDKQVCRLKRSRLISSQMSGLGRAMTIIARHFLFDVYGNDSQMKGKTIDVLKAWLGHKRPADSMPEARVLYRWLPEYVEKNFLAESLEDLEKFIQMGKLKEDDQSKLNKLIDQLRTDEKSPAEKKAAAVELEQLCENLKFIPENKSVHKSIVKIENFLCSLAYRRSFNLSGYADSGKANDVNAINYDRVLGNARRAGSLKKYYLACDRFLMDDITMDSGRRLKESDWDLVLKMTACCMLELSRKGKEKVLRTKAVCVNESDFIDWLMLEKNCGKSKLLQFRYHGETLFEHPSFSGDENRKMQKKGINTKKIRLAQRWLEDSGFEILCDDPETNVIQNYLNLHPEGRVFVDNGSGKQMTERHL